jgi:hypothetical protein
MNVVLRIAAILALACAPLAAKAEMYKCKQPDGSAAYQDHPCEAGADEKVLKLQGEHPSLLVSTMADIFVVALRSSAKQGLSSGTISQPVASCLMHLESWKLNAALDASLHDLLDPDELRATNQFFLTPAGKKFARKVLVEAYIGMGEPAPDSPPAFTADEETEVGKFNRSSAGSKLLSKNGIARFVMSPVVVKRVGGMAQSCGAGQKAR